MTPAEPCECAECKRAGVSRPTVAPLGQSLHGQELEGYWRERDAFFGMMRRVKKAEKA